jgi:hypothetical protein
MVKLKRIITFTKRSRKKLEIKIIRTKLKNIILPIWIEKWNWKRIKLLQKDQEKKIQRMRTKLEYIIFGDLKLNDEIENKLKFYKNKSR